MIKITIGGVYELYSYMLGQHIEIKIITPKSHTSYYMQHFVGEAFLKVLSVPYDLYVFIVSCILLPQTSHRFLSCAQSIQNRWWAHGKNSAFDSLFLHLKQYILSFKRAFSFIINPSDSEK